jgi:hypothetical protein
VGLFRDRSIAQVVHHLELVLPTPGGGTSRAAVRAVDTRIAATRSE